MMSTIELLWQPACQRLAIALVHFLWQGLAAMALIAVVVRVFRLRHGPQRYTAYLLGMLVMVACPVATFLVVEVPCTPQLDTAHPDAPIRQVAFPAPLREDAGVNVGAEGSPVGGPAEASKTAARPKGATITSARATPDGMKKWSDVLDKNLSAALPWIAAVWVAGVCALRVCEQIAHLSGMTGQMRWMAL